MNTVQPEEIERALRQLRGVEAARVCWDQGGIAEVHIAAAPGTRPKHIARDVRSYLAAALGIDVDHKKISIALRKTGEESREEAARAPGRDARARLESLTLRMEGSRAEVQVRLSVNGRQLQGGATGMPTARGMERMVIAATLEALQQLVRDEVRLVPGELRRLRVGGHEARLVQVTVWRPHEEQALLGACWVRQDPYRAVVLATLDALNRALCRLAPIHWMEIRVEPGVAEEEGEELS